MTSTIRLTNNRLTSRTIKRLQRAACRSVIVLTITAAFIPATAGVSNGAGTTAVSAATNDPLAVAAAQALDLLRGGSGSTVAAGKVAVPSSPVTVPATVPQTVPPTGGSSVPAAPVTEQWFPAPTQPPIVSGYATPATTRTNAASEVNVAQQTNGVDGPSRFAAATTSPVVSLLPPPTQDTLPVSGSGSGSGSGSIAASTSVPGAAPATTVAPVKKTKKKVTSTTAAGVAVGAPIDSAAPSGSTGSTGSTYDTARRSVAELVAARLSKLDVDQLDRAWSQAEPRRMVAVYAALAQVGTYYRYSGNEPGGFDCSGLTSYAWSVAGVKIPRTSTDQINAASARTTDQLLPGDLVWRPGHIMMFLGAGEFIIDSPQTGKSVTVRQWGHTSRYGSPI